MTSLLRHCLRDPIPEIEVAGQRLNDAVTAHRQGRTEVAEWLFQLANDDVIRSWLESVWAKDTVYNRIRRKLDHPPVLPRDQRSLPRDATQETRRLVHQRDGYYCRFCKIPVIRSEIRTAIHKLYPDAVPWGTTNVSQHAAFQCMWAQYDHGLPHARGGRSDLENMFLTCAACNYGRGVNLLEELDLVHPNDHSPRQGDWDGLERFDSAR